MRHRPAIHAPRCSDETYGTVSAPWRQVVMLADTGERYLSTPMFDGISADMDEEELVRVMAVQ